jgi:diguanylate cyclase (GGDEF)-like protein
LRQFTVGVVDDCVDEVTVLREGLRLHGYEVVSAHTGEEALKLCRDGAADLLLLDVGLPDLNGYEVCRQLKADPATRDIPIIFVTAKGAAEHVAEGYDLGAVDYIAKPYNLPIVMVRVDAAIRTRQVGDYVRSHSELLHDSAYTDELTGLRNRRFLLERLQEEVEKAHRYNYPVSCLVVDVDEVQALDPEMGAAAMDDVLVEVGMMLRSSSRTYDVLARYDGALFAAVLPHAVLDDALSYAKKIHDEAVSTTFAVPAFPTAARLSIGVVSCRNGSARGAQEVFGEAMRRLLQAKSAPNGQHRIAARDLSQQH